MSDLYGTPWDLPLDDRDASVETSIRDLRELQGTRILVTGGTGFLGRWLVLSLAHANERLDLDLDLVLLSRRPDRLPIAGRPGISLVEGDVRSIRSPGPVDIVIHGAASSSAAFGKGDGEPRAMAATIVDGANRILDIASKFGSRVLMLSSGAVYGPQTAPVGEENPGAPQSLDPRSAYGQAKRLAETLCVSAAQSSGLPTVIARLFAFVGPGIPLDAHYAAGNFLRDLLMSRVITVQGDGTPLRSYLYSGELPEWCWAILARGTSGTAYNVGSPVAISIKDLARMVATLHDPSLDVHVEGTPSGEPASWYVPNVDRATKELGLSVRVNLETALAKTFSWHLTRQRTT